MLNRKQDGNLKPPCFFIFVGFGRILGKNVEVWKRIKKQRGGLFNE